MQAMQMKWNGELCSNVLRMDLNLFIFAPAHASGFISSSYYNFVKIAL